MRTEEYRPLIPVGAENAATYRELSAWWGVNQRTVRRILHKLSIVEPPDGFVIIRSSNSRGFYRTNDEAEIRSYQREIVRRATNTLMPAYAIDRHLLKKSEKTDGNNTTYGIISNGE